MEHTCKKCKDTKSKNHIFKSKEDYVEHGENAIYTIFNDKGVIQEVIDELLTEMDEMDVDTKATFMQGMFNDMGEDYTKYKLKFKLCNKINGCHIVKKKIKVKSPKQH